MSALEPPPLLFSVYAAGQSHLRTQQPTTGWPPPQAAVPKTTEGPSYCDPVGSANLGRNHLFPFRSRCLKRNITDIPLHKVAWRIQPRNPRADQHWQRLRCNESANLICTFVMPAICLIDTRHDSPNSRYVNRTLLIGKHRRRQRQELPRPGTGLLRHLRRTHTVRFGHANDFFKAMAQPQSRATTLGSPGPTGGHGLIGSSAGRFPAWTAP